jgi:hypothetical protein
MHYTGTKPIASSWAEFLNKDEVEAEASTDCGNVQGHIPYATMTLQQKIQRANLALCYSLFKAKTAGAYNNRGNPSQSNSIDNDNQKSNCGKSYGLNGSEQAAGRKRDRNRNYGRNETNNNDEEENESSDDEHHKKRINRSSRIPVILESRRFACPYSKKDPERFRKTVCCLSFWPSISRLKYVLYIER